MDMEVGELVKMRKFMLQRSECFDAAPTKLFLVIQMENRGNVGWCKLKELNSGKEFMGYCYEEYWDKGNKIYDEGLHERNDEHVTIKNCPTAKEERWNKETFWKRIQL